mmetsp:Transcript_26902/g.59541  ORF Transcript_26902/g.59541 Transcript_26902/m.59541 type:complete len:286 (-) Transcript_26902:42-899(-)
MPSHSVVNVVVDSALALQTVMQVFGVELPYTAAAVKRRSGEILAYQSMVAVLVAVVVVAGTPSLSVLITLAAIVQMFGFVMVSWKVDDQGSFAGIPRVPLQLHVVAIIFRLIATITHLGYLPTDYTGEGVVQLVDVGALVVLFGLLARRGAAPAAQQSWWTYALGAAGLALAVHPELNRCRWADWCWMAGVLVEIVAVAATSEIQTTQHLMGCILAAKAMLLVFWMEAYPQLRVVTHDRVTGVIRNNLMPSYAVLLAFSAQLLCAAWGFGHRHVPRSWRPVPVEL